MHLDIVDLAEFYYASPLGRTVRRILQGRIRERWPDIAGQRLLGLGYAAPFMRLFKDEATHMACAMPAEQGVAPWPPEGPYVSTLCHDSLLPFPDASIDRILAVHSLEHSVHLGGLLSEAWRVLTDDGKMLILVPNRRSMWARAEKTPFGHGRPFSRNQLKRMLKENGFSPVSLHEALFMPPLSASLILRSSRTLEKLGRRLIPAFGGALIVEVRKEVYRPVGKLKRSPLHHLKPALAPAPVASRLNHRRSRPPS